MRSHSSRSARRAHRLPPDAKGYRSAQAAAQLRALSADDLVLLRVLIESDMTIRADRRRTVVDLMNNLRPANAESANAESMTKT